MFGFDDGQQAYDRAYDDQAPRHEGHFSHEVVAGGAAFAGLKMYEDRQRAEGKDVKHQFAKEMLAGIVGGEVDKLCETKGLDFIDRERARNQAQDNAEQLYDQRYN